MKKMTEFEVSIIKRLLHQRKKNQEILEIINSRRSISINIGRISDVKLDKKQKYSEIPMASISDLNNYLKKHLSSPTSNNTLKSILFSANKVSLNNKEGQNLEYKREFTKDILNKTYKTICGLANSRGGYIVFGVEDKSKDILGLSTKQIIDFKNKDGSDFNFERIFNQEVKFKIRTYSINKKELGILYIYKSQNKPVMFNKKFSEYKEGEIYYRYNGKTELIKSSELQNIIDERCNLKIQNILTDSFKNTIEEIKEKFFNCFF